MPQHRLDLQSCDRERGVDHRAAAIDCVKIIRQTIQRTKVFDIEEVDTSQPLQRTNAAYIFDVLGNDIGERHGSPLFRVEDRIQGHAASNIKNLLPAKHIFINLLIPATNRECPASRGRSKGLCRSEEHTSELQSLRHL